MDRVDAQLPTNPKGWSYLVLTVLFLIGTLITVFAYEQHLADTQFISGDELKQSIQQLVSYSAEATYLSQHVHDNSAPKAYVSTYASSLQDASDSLVQKLQEHPHADNIDAAVSQAVALGQELSDNLQQLGAEPSSQLEGSMITFAAINQDAQNLEDSI